MKNKGLCILSTPSLTYALRACDLLLGYGIVARAVSVDPSLTKKGCSHGIELECHNKSAAKKLLLDKSIPVSELI